MINPREMCGASDVEAAVLQLAANRSAIKDVEYFYATVGFIEDEIDPTTRSPLTMSGLNAWVSRCTTAPTDGEPDNEDLPRRRIAPNRGLPDAAS